MDHITDIQLLPTDSSLPKFRQKLKQSVERAEILRSAIAYWTIQPDFISYRLSELLSKSDSFMCADIHSPTNLLSLQAFAQEQANVFLHLRKIEGDTENGVKGMPENLLHTKLLLFDMPDGKGELWIGSHNWTKRAILNLNIEASIVIELSQQSVLYNHAKTMLENIKSLSTRFDPNDLEYYIWLQTRDQKTASIIELEGNNAHNLSYTEIVILGDYLTDFKDINTVNKELNLSVIDSHTGAEYVYRAEVDTPTATPARILSLSADLDIPGQRYFLKVNRCYPKLEVSSGNFDRTILSSIKYCVVIRVGELLNVQTLESSTRETRWVAENKSSFVNPFFDNNDHEIALSLLKQIKIKRPASRQNFLKPQSQSLNEKRQLAQQKLVSRKILQDKPKA